MNEKLEEIIARVGGNTDKLKTNLNTERYDLLISTLGGNPKELLTNLETEKLDKLIELFGGDITTLETNLKSEKFNKIIEVLGGKPVTNNYLDEIINLIEELNEIEVEGQEITITDSTASNCSIEIQGNTEQEVRSGKNLLGMKNILDINSLNNQTKNGVKITINEEKGSITFNGTCTQAFLMYINLKESVPAGSVISFGAFNNKVSSNNLTLMRTYNSNPPAGVTTNEISTSFDTLNSKKENYTLLYDMTDIQIRLEANETYSNFEIFPQLELSSTLSSFERYGIGPSPEYPCDIYTVKGNCEVVIENEDKTRKQTYQLTIPEEYELAKIGDYEDYFYKENGKWYKYSIIGKKTLDGNENWIAGVSQDLTNTNLFYHIISGQNQSYGTEYIPEICNYFKVDRVWGKDYEGTCIQSNNGALMIRLNKERLEENTVNGFKNWVSKNNITIMYELAEPIIEEITDKTLLSQLNSLANVRTYYGTTYINASSEITPTLKVTYKQIKN